MLSHCERGWPHTCTTNAKLKCNNGPRILIADCLASDAAIIYLALSLPPITVKSIKLLSDVRKGYFRSAYGLSLLPPPLV